MNIFIHMGHMHNRFVILFWAIFFASATTVWAAETTSATKTACTSASSSTARARTRPRANSDSRGSALASIAQLKEANAGLVVANRALTQDLETRPPFAYQLGRYQGCTQKPDPNEALNQVCTAYDGMPRHNWYLLGIRVDQRVLSTVPSRLNQRGLATLQAMGNTHRRTAEGLPSLARIDDFETRSVQHNFQQWVPPVSHLFPNGEQDRVFPQYSWLGWQGHRAYRTARGVPAFVKSCPRRLWTGIKSIPYLPGMIVRNFVRDIRNTPASFIEDGAVHLVTGLYEAGIAEMPRFRSPTVPIMLSLGFVIARQLAAQFACACTRACGLRRE